MAWGGGVGLFGNPSVRASGANPGGGLPFAGVPDEMRRGVERLTQDEPDWPAPKGGFSHRMPAGGVSLRSMLRPHRRLLIATSLLVIVEALTIQAGPFLGQIGIDDGITPRNWGVVIAAAGAALVAAIVATLASRYRVLATGQISAKVMSELRVRVFSHLQRLSLDYFTDEKAGVIMTRMTSDIEALQQLLQDGLVQFAVQGLTMVVVAVVLFFYSVQLALITLVLLLPPLIGLSMWFRVASDRGYTRVRDGIARVLSDLSENLSGVRVVASVNRQRHNVLHHRNVVGGYQDDNNHTAHLSSFYGATTEWIGVIGQGILLLVGGNMARIGIIAVAVRIAGLGPGYQVGHLIVGSIVSIVCIAAALIFLAWTITAPGQRRGRARLSRARLT